MAPPKSNTPPMSASSFTVNPAASTELLQFYVTEDFNLGLAKWPSQAAGTVSGKLSNSVEVDGPIKFPSSVTAVANQNEAKVFGFVHRPNPENKEQEQVRVAQLSPVLAGVDSWGVESDFGPHITSAGDSQGSAWLYYFRGGEIQCKAISEREGITNHDLNMATTPATNSYLAAYCSPASDGRAFVIYQDTKGRIHEFNTATKDDLLITTDRDYPLGTPLATCVVPNGPVFLYLLDHNNILCRAMKFNSGRDGMKWSRPDAVGGNDEIEVYNFTQLCAIVNTGPSLKSNTVFYMSKDSDDSGKHAWVRYTDPWPKFDEPVMSA